MPDGDLIRFGSTRMAEITHIQGRPGLREETVRQGLHFEAASGLVQNSKFHGNPEQPNYRVEPIRQADIPDTVPRRAAPTRDNGFGNIRPRPEVLQAQSPSVDSVSEHDVNYEYRNR